jgi:hypothetical protein
VGTILKRAPSVKQIVGPIGKAIEEDGTMARFVQAVSKYGPRIQSRAIISHARLCERLVLTTGLRRSQVMVLLIELGEALSSYAATGASLRVEGIGRFYTTTSGKGRLSLNYRPDRELRRALASLDDFGGTVINRKNVGLSPGDYKELWDAEFPDDPLELPRLRSEAAA